MPNLQRFLAKAHAAGVPVALGTDTPFPHEVPGFAVHDELAMYVEAGLSPVDALRCATVTNAQVLGIGREVGQLSSGFVADMVCVRGDPTIDIDDIGQVEAVVHRGLKMLPTDLFAAVQQHHARPAVDPVSMDLRGRVIEAMPKF